MTDLQNLLDQIQRLDQEAEAGPWDHDREVNTENGWSLGAVRSHHTGESVTAEVYDADGAFIALACTALPQLAKALRAVLDLHKREGARKVKNRVKIDRVQKVRGTKLVGGVCGYCDEMNMDSHLPTDAISWPCPTVQAIADALGDDDA